MDILPQQVIKIMQDVLLDNKLSSWRVFCDEKIVISLHYKPVTIDDQGGCMSSHNIGQQYAFRRKPPSAIERDRLRQDKWKGAECTVGHVDSGINMSSSDMLLENNACSSTPFNLLTDFDNSPKVTIVNGATNLQDQSPMLSSKRNTSTSVKEVQVSLQCQDTSKSTQTYENANVTTQVKSTQSDGSGYASAKIQTEKAKMKDKCYQALLVAYSEQSSQVSVTKRSMACMTNDSDKYSNHKALQTDLFMENRHCQTIAPVNKTKSTLIKETFSKTTQVKNKDISKAYKELHVVSTTSTSLSALSTPQCCSYKPTMEDVMQQLQTMNSVLDEKIPALSSSVNEMSASLKHGMNRNNDGVT